MFNKENKKNQVIEAVAGSKAGQRWNRLDPDPDKTKTKRTELTLNLRAGRLQQEKG